MPTFTDRATRTLKLQKAERPKIGYGLPPVMDGFEGENRIQIVNGNPRLYYKTNSGWYFTGLVQDGSIPDIPIATSTQLGLVKIGSGGTISSDGTYTATAATPAADDITGGDAAVTITTSSGNITIDAAANNSDVIFKGTDATSDITMLTLDGSEAGNAIFNANVTIGALLIMPDVTNNKILVSDGTSYQEVALSGDATIANTGAITLAAAQTNITSIYATDLIIGEDSQTAIDFGTANEIDFKINNSTELTLDASALYPVTDAGLDLGTSTLEFKDAFFDGTVTSDAFAGPLTGNVTGDVSGNAGTVTVATRSTDATHYLLFSSATSGSLSVYDNASFNLNPSTGALTVPNMTISTGLTVNGLTASDNLDIGTYGFRAAELYADNRTSGRVAFYAANGQLQDDSDLTFATATLTATNIVGSTSIKTPYLDLDRGSTGAGYILFREDSDNGTNYVQVIGPASTANVTLTLPSSAGTIARTADIPDWTASGTGTIHSTNYTDTVDMGDGFKLADADSNVDVTEGEYVKFTTQQGSGGIGVVTGAGTSGDPHLVTLNYADTNTTYTGGTGLTLSSTTFNVDASQTQITAVGTIGTGVWQGSSIAVGYTDAKCTNANADQTSANTCSRGATLTDEAIQDLVGAMVSGNTETNCTVTYQDSDGTIDFITQDTNTTYTAGTGLDLVSEEFRLDLSDVITNSTNNRVITDINGDSLNAEANLTFDGSTLTCAGDATFAGTVLATGELSTSANAVIDGHMMIGGSDITSSNGNLGRILKMESDNNSIIIGESTTNNRYLIFEARQAGRSGNERVAQIGLGGDANNDGEIFMFTSADGADVTQAFHIDAAQKATFAGTIYGEADVVAYYSSDPTLKTNKELISNPLDKIDSIGGYSFDWKESAEEYAPHLKGHDYGVMADEIQELFPELVQTRDNGIRAVKYDKLVPLLIEGIKELKHELDMIKGVS